MRVYDPRDKQWKESDNPALMVAQFMDHDAVNWSWVAEQANYCDEECVTLILQTGDLVEITAGEGATRVEVQHEATARPKESVTLRGAPRVWSADYTCEGCRITIHNVRPLLPESPEEAIVGDAVLFGMGANYGRSGPALTAHSVRPDGRHWCLTDESGQSAETLANAFREHLAREGGR